MFLPYINLFRAIATIFVVVNHSIHGLQWGMEYDNFEMSRALKIIFSNGALFFVFISGFLFQHLLPRYKYTKFLISRFLLVVLPYLVVSIPAVFAWVFLYQKSAWGIPHDLYQHPWWYIAGFYYVSGQHMAPLWFIPMIVIFYLLSPLFEQLDRHPVFYLSIPLLMWLSWEHPRDWSPWGTFPHFLSVYVIGMAASRYKEPVLKWSWKLRYVLMGLFVALVAYELLRTHSTMSYFNYLNKLTLSFLIIAVLAHYSDRPFRALTWFAGINFSVFFLHTYANAGMKILFAGGPARSLDIVGNVFYQAIYASLLIGISIVICLIVKKIAGKFSKYLIGA